MYNLKPKAREMHVYLIGQAQFWGYFLKFIWKQFWKTSYEDKKIKVKIYGNQEKFVYLGPVVSKAFSLNGG